MTFDRVVSILNQGIEHKLHLGAQLYVSQRGQTLIDTALGESRPGVAMTTDTINLWMSAVKPTVAAAVMQIWQRGLLDLDDRVAAHIPEFAARGKEAITIRHILTHTCGFRAVVGLRANDSFDVAVEKVCAAPLEPHWIPGQMAGYQPTASWFVLGELVRRLDGRGIDQYLREKIYLQLGMSDCYLGLPSDAYERYGERAGFMFDTSGSTIRESSHANAPEDAAAVRPSGNGRGPINQLAKFYEMVLRRGRSESNQQILLPQTVDAMIAHQRVGLVDQTFKSIIDWGLGFYLQSHYITPDAPYGYGAAAGWRTFGHSGNQSSCAFCDPDSGLVVAWFCNGMPGEGKHRARQSAINRAIYEDLAAVS